MNTKNQQTLIDLRDGLISQIGLPDGTRTVQQVHAEITTALAKQKIAGPRTLATYADAGLEWNNARPVFYENELGDGSGTIFTVYDPEDTSFERPLHVTNRHVSDGFPKLALGTKYGRAYCVDTDGVDLKFFTRHGIDAVTKFLSQYPPLAAFRAATWPTIKTGGFPYGIRQGCIETREAEYETNHESGRLDCPYYVTQDGPFVGGMSGSPFYSKDAGKLLGAGFARGYAWDNPRAGANHWIAAQHFYSDMPIRAM